MGRWQIESGATFFRTGGSEFVTLGETLLRLPLNERTELRLGNLGFGRANAAGGGGEGLLDPVLGVKFRFQAGTAGQSPDLALVVQSTVPLGGPDFRVKRAQPTLKLAGYYQATAVDGLGWNVVWSSLGKDQTRVDQWAVSGYWSRTINARTGTFVEVYRLLPGGRGGRDSNYADAGIVYLLDKATQIDFRLGTGFDQRREGWFIGAGMSFRW